MEKNIRLIDYERITNEDHKRLVRSGPFAGNKQTTKKISKKIFKKDMLV